MFMSNKILFCSVLFKTGKFVFVRVRVTLCNKAVFSKAGWTCSLKIKSISHHNMFSCRNEEKFVNFSV